jgi:hypothetical protein
MERPQTKPCRGLLLYYSTCLYLLLLRLLLTMHGHAPGGNERGGTIGNRNGNKERGRCKGGEYHWNWGGME